MVTALSCQEQIASVSDIDAGAWGYSIEELDLHAVDILLSKVECQLVKVAILALEHEKERLVVEDGVGGDE